MPTYSYACTACTHRFDAVQSIFADALIECPECAGTIQRVISSVGVSFKGSGFYRTDSRSGGSRSGNKGRAGSSSEASTPSASVPAAPSKPTTTSAAADPS